MGDKKQLQKASLEDLDNINPKDYDDTYLVKSLTEFTNDIIIKSVFDEISISLIEDCRYFDKESLLLNNLLNHTNITNMYNDYLLSEKIKWILKFKN